MTHKCLSSQVVSKPLKRAQAKGHAPPRQQQPATKAASQAGAPLYKRCPSMTSISDSMCSADSDQSMVTASSGVGSQAPARQHHHLQQQQQQLPPPLQHQQGDVHSGPPRPAKPGSPGCMPPPGRPNKGPMQNGAAAVPKSRLAPPDLHPAAGGGAAAEGAQQPQPQTWAGRVAGTRACGDAKQAGYGAAAQPSRAEAPEPAATAAAAGASPPCSEPGGSCSSSDRSVATADTDSEKAALAAEVGRLRSALAQSEAARQQEVAFLLKRAAEHEAAVSHVAMLPNCLSFPGSTPVLALHRTFS